MKAASELIREFQTLELTTKDKLAWLENSCQDYEQLMPNDRTGQSTLYCLLGDSYLDDGNRDQAKSAFLKAKEILERKIPVRKKVGCGYQEMEKDFTDSQEYQKVLEKLADL